MRAERSGRVVRVGLAANHREVEEPMSGPKPKDKPFVIAKWVVWEAYRRVKANDGAAGVDEQSIEEFERNLKRNLYKLWNRMSSGSYFPAPVRAVETPKKHGQGKVRVLGVPTVADRIAQTVVRLYLEPSYVERLLDGACTWIATYVDLQDGLLHCIPAHPRQVAAVVGL